MVSEEDYLPYVDDLLLETIGDVLNQVFGENAAKTILRHMKKSSSLKWDEIPGRIEVFAESLQKILGQGAVIIEDLILETLCQKFGLELESNRNSGFKDSIMGLRNRLERER